MTWSCCSSVSPANSGSIIERSDARSVAGRSTTVSAYDRSRWMAITPRRVGTPSSSSRRISSLRSTGASAVSVTA